MGTEAELFAEVRRRIASISAELPPAPDVCEAAREVVVVGSSSRGGSSIFADVLRRSPLLLHLKAEINPFFRLHDCEREDSDAIPADALVPAALGLDLGRECGNPTGRLDGEAAVRRFAVEVAARLSLQWPLVAFDLDFVHREVVAVLGELWSGEWRPGEFRDPQPFHARLLGRLRRRWPEIHPAAYDLDRGLVTAWCPGPWPDPFVPEALVEEPPFVLAVPWATATPDDLATRPLVIKTPSNAYRMDWLRRVFPNARVRVLHLVRNVAASVNGLYDGWRFPGFHSHRVGGLAIGGYSELVAGGTDWWKFDRPPGWQEYRQAPLAQVAAHQWRSAHRQLLAESGRHVLRFESVMASPDRQFPALAALAGWLGVPVAAHLERVLGSALPLVMATETPRHRRWFARAEMLGPILSDPANLDVMEALGYARDPSTWD